MNMIRTIAIILVIAGVLSLMYGGFSYVRQTNQISLGPIDLTVNERRAINIPMWAGVGVIVVGGALLFVRNPKT